MLTQIYIAMYLAHVLQISWTEMSRIIYSPCIHASYELKIASYSLLMYAIATYVCYINSIAMYMNEWKGQFSTSNCNINKLLNIAELTCMHACMMNK